MKRQAAFTLIELLIVIGILGVLVTILVPVVGNQIEEARRTSCRANLKAIGQKMVEYAQDYKGRFPTAPSKMYTGQATFCAWSGKTGVYRTIAPTIDDDTSVTASQWLLVRAESLPVDAFICPSTNDTPDDYTDAGDVKRDVTDLYDFKSRDNISYSFFMPYGKPILSLLSKPDMAIAADKSPFFDNATGTLVAPAITPAANSKTNSSNNHRQAGQNVVFNDGRAAWFKYANAGIRGDHIYTRYLLPEGGGEYDPRVGAIGNDYKIEVNGDSVLVH